MSLKEIKVRTKTLEQIAEIVDKNPEGRELVQKGLVEAIDKLWRTVCQPQVKLLLTDSIETNVVAKPEFQEIVETITGTKGPYLAIKSCKSWIGLSEGVYQIQDCESFLPIAWFTPAKTSYSLQKILIAALVFISCLQSLILVFLIIL